NGTNSLGTAQSSGSGGSGSNAGVTTGAGRGAGGTAASGPNRAGDSTDATIQQENSTVDRKVKSICRGC
ncbi:MAG: hypothetical protein ACK5BX_37580, partial [Bradyrhizobium sp.]